MKKKKQKKPTGKRMPTVDVPSHLKPDYVSDDVQKKYHKISYIRKDEESSLFIGC